MSPALSARPQVRNPFHSRCVFDVDLCRACRTGLDWVAANATRPAVASISLGGGASHSLDKAVRNLIHSGVTTTTAAGGSSTDACLFSPGRVTEVSVEMLTFDVDISTCFFFFF